MALCWGEMTGMARSRPALLRSACCVGVVYSGGQCGTATPEAGAVFACATHRTSTLLPVLISVPVRDIEACDIKGHDDSARDTPCPFSISRYVGILAPAQPHGERGEGHAGLATRSSSRSRVSTSRLSSRRP